MTFQSNASINVADHYRSGLLCAQASTTTQTVGLGTVDVGGARVRNAAAVTLTISTAGDWIGGSSLRAVSTVGYIYINASGSIKMHTTAPSHSDFRLTLTTGQRRYVSLSSDTWRCIGWFRMNATGSGELDTFGVSNTPDGAIKNRVRRKYTAQQSITINSSAALDDSIPQASELTELMRVGFVKFDTSKTIRVTVRGHLATNNSGGNHLFAAFKDAGASAIYAQFLANINGSGVSQDPPQIDFTKTGDTQLTFFEILAKFGILTAGNTSYFNGNAGGRLFGGVAESYIEIEEIESYNP